MGFRWTSRSDYTYCIDQLQILKKRTWELANRNFYKRGQIKYQKEFLSSLELTTSKQSIVVLLQGDLPFNSMFFTTYISENLN